MTGPARHPVFVARRVGAALAACVVTVSPSALAGDAGATALIFGSMEAGPSAFVTGGAKLALDRIDREGFVALASSGFGSREEGAAAARRTRQTLIGSVVFGHQWFWDWGVAALYAGPEASMEALSGAGGVATAPARFGLRVQSEVWARPTGETLLTATLVLGSTRSSVWGRVSWGEALWGAYLGPEATLYAESGGYVKWGLGLHATDVRLGEIGLRVSAGYLVETGGPGGSPYVGLSLWSPL